MPLKCIALKKFEIGQSKKQTVRILPVQRTQQLISELQTIPKITVPAINRTEVSDQYLMFQALSPVRVTSCCYIFLKRRNCKRSLFIHSDDGSEAVNGIIIFGRSYIFQQHEFKTICRIMWIYFCLKYSGFLTSEFFGTTIFGAWLKD